jgi:protein SCO1/2
MSRWLIVVAFFLLTLSVRAEQRFQVTGIVLKADQPRQLLTVSHESIAGYMGAMVMSFNVSDPKMIDGLEPGTKVTFMLVITKDKSYIEDVHILSFESSGQHPLEARRLQTMESVIEGNQSGQLRVGQPVPDFTFTDQNRKQITLSTLRGRVIALNFVYTSCPLPDYCVRLSNNFGQLQRRFADEMGRDLVLLSITFDPTHDQPEVLAKYASTWKADGRTWHFLTGSPPEIVRVCHLFGVESWADEGLRIHTLHTAIIDRKGGLVVNIDGNQFTAQELGDLLEAQIERDH